MSDNNRGTGVTTLQMKEAPHGAVFVWCNRNLAYPRDLALTLGRGDLEIVSPDAMTDWHRFMGRELSGIVLDHAANLEKRQREGYNKVRSRVCATIGDMAAFGASERACYDYPEDTEIAKAQRAAFCAGAGWAADEIGRLRAAIKKAREWIDPTTAPMVPVMASEMARWLGVQLGDGQKG